MLLPRSGNRIYALKQRPGLLCLPWITNRFFEHIIGIGCSRSCLGLGQSDHKNSVNTKILIETNQNADCRFTSFPAHLHFPSPLIKQSCLTKDVKIDFRTGVPIFSGHQHLNKLLFFSPTPVSWVWLLLVRQLNLCLVSSIHIHTYM